MHRPAALSGFALLALCGAAAAQEPRVRASAASPCERWVLEDVIASASADGEIVLASGRTIRLLDIRLPSEADGLGEARLWLQSLQGQRVVLKAPGGAPDRWNRIAADVALLDEEGLNSLAGLMIDRGLAVVDAGERRALCRPELLAREEQARARRLGLWASGRFQPVAASDMARLQDHIGRFALVEGVVRSVGERRERTYLNFGSDWTSDLTITIAKPVWTALLGRGLSAAALRGRTVRARGIIEEWQGVAVEITAADMLEVLRQEVRQP